MNGREHVLTEGQSIEIPPGTPHTQVPVGAGDGRIRISVRPAGSERGVPGASRRAVPRRPDHALRIPAPGGRRSSSCSTSPPPATPRCLRCGCNARSRGRCRPSPGRCGRTCSSTSGTWPPRPSPCSRRLPTRGPTRAGGDRCTSTSRPTGRLRWGRRRATTSRAGSPITCTPARRSWRSSRPGAWWPTSTVTCAAAGPGRSRPLPQARMCASTGRSTPIARCCGC